MRNKISDVLKELQDDVILKQTLATTDNVTPEPDKSAKEVKTESKIYVQQKEHFVETTKDYLTHTVPGNEFQYNPSERNQSPFPKHMNNETIDVAIYLQRKSHIVGNLCCGLLGGISLMQLVLTYTVVKGSKDELISFIELYSKFRSVLSAIFSILTTVCLVIALDRVDLSTVRLLYKKGKYKLYSNWTLLVIYAITYLLSALCFKFDMMIAEYPDTKTILQSSLDLSAWRTVNLWRSIFGIVGWLFVCVVRPEDLLEHRLTSLKKAELGNNQNSSL